MRLEGTHMTIPLPLQRAVSTVLILLVAAAATPQTLEGRRQRAVQHYRVGQDLLNNEQFEKAEREFSLAVQFDPLLTLAHYGRGQSLMALRRYPSAIQAFTKCLGAFEELFALRKGDVVAMDRRAEQEIRELNDTISALQNGRIKSLPGVAASVDARVAQLEARIRDLRQLRQMDSERFQPPAEVLLALGSAYFRSGDRAAAERHWTTAVRLNDKSGEAWNNLAVIYLGSNRKEAAHVAVRNAERAGFQVHPRLKDDIRAMP